MLTPDSSHQAPPLVPPLTLELSGLPAPPLAPETTLCLTVRVRNQQAEPLPVAIVATGIPPHWLSLSPAQRIVAGGGVGLFTISITPPRGPTNPASSHTLTIVLRLPTLPHWSHTYQVPLGALDAGPRSLLSGSRRPWPIGGAWRWGMAGLVGLVGLMLLAGHGAPLRPRAGWQGQAAVPLLGHSQRGALLPPVAIEAQWQPALPPPVRPTRPVALAPAMPVAPLAPTAVAKSEVAALAPAAPPSYELLFREVGAQYGIDWRLLASVAYHESRLDPGAVGRDGEMGLMQLLPSTWAAFAPRVGAEDPFDPASNVRVGAAYLAHVRQIVQQGGHPEEYWALVAYNWGPTRLSALFQAGGGWGDVPLMRQDYAYRIMEEVAAPSAAWWAGVRAPLPP